MSLGICGKRGDMNLYYFIDSIRQKRYSADHHIYGLVEQIISRYGRREKKYDKTVYKNEDFDIKIYSLDVTPELLDAELHLEKKSTIKSRFPLAIRKFMHTKLKFPLLSSMEHESILHYFSIPTYKTVKNVKTILELPTIKEFMAPEFFNNGYQLFNYIKLIDSADVVVTHSKYMAEQLITKLFIDESKIKIIPRGILEKSPEHKVDQYRLPEKFILFTGKISIYKNLERLFKSFYKAAPKDTYLVIAGDTPGLYMEGLKKFAASMPEDKIKFIGYVNSKIMPSIIREATALIEPSHINDFPDTIIEAQNIGVPVIASDIEAHRCVCKDSVLYFSSLSEKSMADAIDAIASNSSVRNPLIKAGKHNAEKYRWDHVAPMYRALYKSLG
jgi:glycosyltransferase involved in cell wall biosynthesis